MNEKRELFFDLLSSGLDIPTSCAANDYWLTVEPEMDEKPEQDHPVPRIDPKCWVWCCVVAALVLWWLLG